MPRPLVVINVVGLTHEMLGPKTPNISRLADEGFARPMGTVLPAVTCSAQSTLLTGVAPSEHGIVGNGWYFRDLAEVGFWKQSNHLVGGETVYDAARQRDPNYTVAKMFWWYNMYARVDWSVTPRPCYAADGRKLFDSYSEPPGLKGELQDRLGVFPLLKFWGPGANIESSRWIASASIDVFERYTPNLTLIYLPHLDYNLQRIGPNDPAIVEDIRLVDAEAGRIIDAAQTRGADVVVLSEYGITEVNRPIHLNRILRDEGYLVARREISGWETLDCGASRAFAVADHQVAHVYVRKPEDMKPVAELLERVSGVERVLEGNSQNEFGTNHGRSGELVVVSERDAWFTYYFWQDDALAPDYARTVDIHRKPGYDPVELFVDPKLKLPKLRIARRFAQKLLGFRYYMDVIGLDAEIVRGSHGRLPDEDKIGSDGAIFVSSSKSIERDTIAMSDVKQMLLDLQFGPHD